MGLKDENQILKDIEVHNSVTSALETICNKDLSLNKRAKARKTYLSLINYAETKTGQELPEMRKLYWKVMDYF